MMTRTLKALLALTVLLGAPLSAHADLFGFRLGPKVAFTRGSGDVYKGFDQWLGSGAELGVEILFIDIFADFFFMGNKQYLATANVGFDTTFGDDFRVTVGLYTGPMFYIFPKQEADELDVPLDIRQELESAGVNVDGAIEAYNDASEEEAELSRLAFGWNVARLRLEADMKIAPVVYFGLQTTAGFHFIISGEEVAAGAKGNAIEKAALEYRLTAEQKQTLRELVGARDVDVDNLNGVNYSIGLYFRLEL
ncbi:MAG: hypothetical protein KC549_16440 [Myxococcales bacterium]|nr:hypothetical protein [Myxococcales bacterium]